MGSVLLLVSLCYPSRVGGESQRLSGSGGEVCGGYLHLFWVGRGKHHSSVMEALWAFGEAQGFEARNRATPV